MEGVELLAFMFGDEGFDVLSVDWDCLVSCVSVDPGVIHGKVERFERVADHEVLEDLCLVCVGDEVHAGGFDVRGVCR